MAKKTAKKSSRKKRTPPRPKNLSNLPKGLQAYWRKRGTK